jgi:hypothetical protein
MATIKARKQANEEFSLAGLIRWYIDSFQHVFIGTLI